MYICIYSLYLTLKGILHRSQWRRRVSDGGGYRPCIFMGHTPNTMRSGGLKKKPLELEYCQV